MIAHPIMALIGSIQFQDVTRQELQHVAQGMEFVANHSVQLRAALEDPGDEYDVQSVQAAITELMAHYVMSQERNIHHAATGSGEREEGARFYCFSPDDVIGGASAAGITRENVLNRMTVPMQLQRFDGTGGLGEDRRQVEG